MATNGLVTVRKNGEVVLKIVVGIDGMFAPKVAEAIRELGRVPSIKEANDMAAKAHFGAYGERVIVNRQNLHTFLGDNERYRTTFHDPEFNPRWHHGTAEYTEIIDF